MKTEARLELRLESLQARAEARMGPRVVKPQARAELRLELRLESLQARTEARSEAPPQIRERLQLSHALVVVF